MKPLPSGAIYWLLFTVTFIALFLGTARPAVAAEKRDRAWLLGYVRQPIKDSPRHRAILKIIDQAELAGVIDRKWLEEGKDSGKGRTQATLIGQLAFAYHTRGTRWHKSEKLLEEVRAGFRGFVSHQTAEGRFVWPKQQKYEYQAHEHVWRLEPLLLAYLWVESDLTPQERKEWLAVLKKAGEYLLRHPLTEGNNRGAVWAAGTLLCGLAFEDDRYLKLARQHGPKIMTGVLSKTGEVVETQGGGGPDGNYSYVGWAYAYHYRLLAGADDMDEALVRCLRWLVHYSTVDGSVIVPGAATRKQRVNGDPVVMLAALEYYAAKDSFLAHVASRYIEYVGDGGFGKGGLTVNSLIWALLERPAPAVSDRPPAWFVDHLQVYDWPKMQYALIGRPTYHTGLSLRGHFGVRGLQTFALHLEPPMVKAGRGGDWQNATGADGINTSHEDIAKGPAGWEVWFQQGKPQKEWNELRPTVLITRCKTLWTCYAITPSSLVVVYGGNRGPMQSTWVMDGTKGAALDKDLRQVRFANRTGRITYLRGQTELKTDVVPMLLVSVEAGPNAFGFSGDSFRFAANDGQQEVLRFSDASGNYELSLKGMLGRDGNIDRKVPERLTRVKKE